MSKEKDKILNALHQEIKEKNKKIEKLESFYYKQLYKLDEEYNNDLEEREKAIDKVKQQLKEKVEELKKVVDKLKQSQKQLATQELEKVNNILTDTIIEVTQNEFDLNKLYYLEEISAKFGEKIQTQIKKLKN